MKNLKLIEGEESQRKDIANKFFGMEMIPDEYREKIITAWITSIENSTFEKLEEIPYSLSAPSYKLLDHTNEVTNLGLLFSDFFKGKWRSQIDKDELITALILHDVDKPMLMTIDNGKLLPTEYYRKIMHGVLGSLILRDLEFPDSIVFTVASHSINSTIHGDTPIDVILHYADFLSADHAIVNEGKTPFFHRKFLG